jgi:ribosomal protein S18 acetylase RimI-like enzyme
MTIDIKSFEVELSLTKSLSAAELALVADWITKSGELPIISGSTGQLLSLGELQIWFESATQGIIAKHNGEIIGIATLTKEEAPIPNDALEICHCIVHPNYRRLYNGSSLIIRLTAFAKQNGFNRVVGRVAKSNPIGKTLLQYLHWHLIESINYSNDNNVVWLEKKFTTHGK